MPITSVSSMPEMGLKMSPGKSMFPRNPKSYLKIANYYRRHLLRLWLRDPENAWETPKPLQPRWDTVYKDVTEDEQAFPLEPALRKTVGS